MLDKDVDPTAHVHKIRVNQDTSKTSAPPLINTAAIIFSKVKSKHQTPCISRVSSPPFSCHSGRFPCKCRRYWMGYGRNMWRQHEHRRRLLRATPNARPSLKEAPGTQTSNLVLMANLLNVSVLFIRQTQLLVFQLRIFGLALVSRRSPSLRRYVICISSL